MFTWSLTPKHHGYSLAMISVSQQLTPELYLILKDSLIPLISSFSSDLHVALHYHHHHPNCVLWWLYWLIIFRAYATDRAQIWNLSGGVLLLMVTLWKKNSGLCDNGFKKSVYGVIVPVISIASLTTLLSSGVVHVAVQYSITVCFESSCVCCMFLLELPLHHYRQQNTRVSKSRDTLSHSAIYSSF